MTTLQREITESQSFRQWKRCHQKNFLIRFLLVAGVTAALFFLLKQTDFSTVRRQDLLFGGFAGVLFGCCALGQLVCLFKSFKWEPRQCWKGRIVGMHKDHLPNHHIKAYCITAEIEPGKQLDGTCLPGTYNAAVRGDPVYLFTLQSDQVYCISACKKI